MRRLWLIVLCLFCSGAAAAAEGVSTRPSPAIRLLQLSQNAKPTATEVHDQGTPHHFGEFLNIGLAEDPAIWLEVALTGFDRALSLKLTDLQIEALTSFHAGPEDDGDGGLVQLEHYDNPLIGAAGVPLPDDPTIHSVIYKVVPRQHISLRLELGAANVLSIGLSRMLSLKMMAVAVVLVISLVSFCAYFLFKLLFLIYFGLYGLGMTILLFNYSGLGSIYVTEFAHYADGVVFVTSHTVTAACFYAFLAAFLNLEAHTPKLFVAFRVGMLFSFLASIFALFDPAAARMLVPVSGVVSVALISVAVITMLTQNTLHLKIYLLSSALYLGFISIYILNLTGIAPDHILFGYELSIGTSIDMAMLLAAVAAKAKAIESDRLEERQRAQAMIEWNSRLASLGLFAGGIAHEVNNPLAIIKGSASNLRFLLESGRNDKALLLTLGERIEDTVDRIAKIIHSLRVLAGGKTARDDLSLISLSEIIAPVSTLTNERYRSVAFKTEGWRKDVYLLGDIVQFSQAILNLVANAVEAVRADPAGWVSVKAYASERTVRIEIANSGPKVPDDIAAKIFDPFFTTRPVGAGMGLGLSICKTLIDSLDGKIELDPGSRHTTFVITFDRVYESDERKLA